MTKETQGLVVLFGVGVALPTWYPVKTEGYDVCLEQFSRVQGAKPAV